MTQFKPAFSIGNFPITRGGRPMVVAELSGNHNGELQRALDLVRAAAAAGADAVKLQTYTADTMTINHGGEDFQIRGGLWDGHNLYSLYQMAATPWQWHEALFSLARELGLEVFSTPFDETSVDFLEQFDPPAYKIASFELTDLALVDYVASKGRPMIVSSGMANLEEISAALDTIHRTGNDRILLLHCVSGYPTPVDQANIATMADMMDRFGCPIGLSDHSPGTGAAIAAVAQGACFIEKHFTLRRSDGGPDAAFSLEPEELSQLVDGCNQAHAAIGTISYDRKEAEKDNLRFRRSLYIVKDVQAGDVLTEENMRRIRPGYGMDPGLYRDMLGKTVSVNIARGTALQPEMINGL